MTHYEYKVIKLGENANIQEILDQYSGAGWRLVQTLQTMGYSTRLVFEREREMVIV